VLLTAKEKKNKGERKKLRVFKASFCSGAATFRWQFNINQKVGLLKMS